MITFKEMAEMLGISTTTVSNVINGKTSEVSQKTAEKVQKLLDEYDYVPNMNAKNLAQNHSRLIGIVLKGKKINTTISSQIHFMANYLDLWKLLFVNVDII